MKVDTNIMILHTLIKEASTHLESNKRIDLLAYRPVSHVHKLHNK